MPKFKIVEQVEETRYVEADNAQEALDAWLIHGQEACCEDPEYSVKERAVYDEDDNPCEVTEQ